MFGVLRRSRAVSGHDVRRSSNSRLRGDRSDDCCRTVLSFGGLACESLGRMVGAGLSLGITWDRMVEPNPSHGIDFLGGAWGGGGYAFSGRANAECGENRSPYVSAALGMRGTEIYFAPKVGVMIVPEICIGPIEFK